MVVDSFNAPSIVVAPAESAEAPISIAPNPELIAPAAKVPTDVICVCAASTLQLCVVPSPLVAAVEVTPVPPVIVPT